MLKTEEQPRFVFAAGRGFASIPEAVSRNMRAVYLPSLDFPAPAENYVDAPVPR